MPSAVDTVTFQNKKTKATLTGSLVQSKDLDQGNTTESGFITGNFNKTAHTRSGINGNALITWSNITTPENSVLVIIIGSATFESTAGSSNKSWLLKRDTTEISTFSLLTSDAGTTTASQKIFTDLSPPIGTFTYTLVENSVSSFGGIVGTLFFIKGTDTHAASSKNINIIN